ncbi:unnamed protein product [Ixodes persulcatus]
MKMQNTKQKKNAKATSDLTTNNEEREKRKRKRPQHILSSFEDDDLYGQDVGTEISATPLDSGFIRPPFPSSLPLLQERPKTQPAPQLPERAPEPKQKHTRELCAPALNRRQKTMSQPSSCRKPTPNGLLLNGSSMHQLGPRNW